MKASKREISIKVRGENGLDMVDMPVRAICYPHLAVHKHEGSYAITGLNHGVALSNGITKQSDAKKIAQILEFEYGDRLNIPVKVIDLAGRKAYSIDAEGAERERIREIGKRVRELERLARFYPAHLTTILERAA